MKTEKLFSKFTLGILFLLAFVMKSNANNVQITGTQVSGSNITFDITWDNSWNASVAPNNWDGVWVFIKYQDCNTRLWAHAGLSILAGDHTTSSPLQVDPVTDGRGVFIRRSSIGGGTVPLTSVTLKMTIPAGVFNYKVFGIEMVNVPQAQFQIGDGISTSTFSSININATSQSGGLTSATLGGAAANVPATFPMGYNSFYCMKYEISQLQYVEYLNSLTYDQQASHVANDPISVVGTYAMFSGFNYRNGVRVSTSGSNAAIPAIFACDATAGVENNSDDGQGIAMNNLSWSDVSAYLDWAALRPMTELEFEKVCRGTATRVANEYPWGTIEINPIYTQLPGLINDFLANETWTPATNGTCNAGLGSNSGIYGPVKVGAFATSSSGRASAGAAYYGAMELGGNLAERFITTSNTSGTAFNGTLGDGTITESGLANQATWPDPATSIGVGFRGGDYVNVVARVRTSDRASIITVNSTRAYNFGGRGVR